MTRYNSSRLNLTLPYHNVYPVVSQYSLGVDYLTAKNQADRLRNSVVQYFRRHRNFRRSRQVYCYTRVHWVNTNWVVQSFCLPRRRRRRRGFFSWCRRVTKPRRDRERFVLSTRTRPVGKWLDLLVRWSRRDRARWSSVTSAWSAKWGGTATWRIRILSSLDKANAETWISYLRYRVRGKFERSANSIVLPLLRHARRSKRLRGCIIKCNGRFTRKQRAGHTRQQYGATRRSDLSAATEQGFLSFPLKFGAVGITITLLYSNGLQKIF